MRYEYQLLMALIGIGLLTKRLSWRAWFFLGLAIFSWIIINWRKG